MITILRKVALLSCVLALGACADMPTAERAQQQGDFVTARKHLETLSEYHIPEAQVDLAQMLLQGEGGPADPKRAIELLQDATNHDFPQAYYEYGRLYHNGQYVKQDFRKAADLYNKAYDMGYIRGAFQLGTLYEQQKSYKLAESFYKQALKGGYYRSAIKLGGLYEKKAEGRPYNPAQALTWYTYAQSKGIEVAPDKITKLESLLTPEEIAYAKTLSRKWSTYD